MSAPEHCLDIVSKFLPKLFLKNSIFFLTVLADQGTCFIGWEFGFLKLCLHHMPQLNCLALSSELLDLPFVFIVTR